MGYVILIFVVIFLVVAIYGFMISLFLFILGVGCIVGLPVGIFYGIKNYISSILDNINNKAFKITMIIITSLIITTIMFYLISIINFLSAYNN